MRNAQMIDAQMNEGVAQHSLELLLKILQITNQPH